MPKRYTPKQVLQRLEKLGFVRDRQSGSHIVLYNLVTKNRAVIPFHLKQLPQGTLLSILREAKIAKREFEEIK